VFVFGLGVVAQAISNEYLPDDIYGHAEQHFRLYCRMAVL
jgi:hypothetical protein